MFSIDSHLQHLEQQMAAECTRTCKIELVESVAQNLTFPLVDNQSTAAARSTFSVWMQLINSAQHSLALAAYKTSLRGKHVLGEQQQSQSETAASVNNISSQGEMVFDALLAAGLERGIPIRMVENAVAKDKGDNEDGNALYRRGALFRRILNLQRLYHTGIMHSKFVLADGRHFYLGSANMDWRSLSQKMELGVFVRDCPCLGQDLAKIFDVYWRAAAMKTATEVHRMIKQLPPAKYNAQRPLRLQDADGHRLAVHLASSPKTMNCPLRSWDLDDILSAIRGARNHIHVHVMDYFPMFLYTQNRRYWPEIDNALREAIMRGVHVRIIAAALHFPDTGLHFLKSLETLGEIPGAGSVEVRIFKVPTPEEVKQPVLRRDRRTHKKFLLTDDALIIGTSNWSGDYFEDRGTGVAIVVRRDDGKRREQGRKEEAGEGGGALPMTSSPSPPTVTGTTTTGTTAPLLFRQMRALFERDWNSGYAHPLEWYMHNCLERRNSAAGDDDGEMAGLQEVCESEKDPTLLNKPNDANNNSGQE